MLQNYNKLYKCKAGHEGKLKITKLHMNWHHRINTNIIHVLKVVMGDAFP